jgi:NADH-quinone oxidoreductase subunit D
LAKELYNGIYSSHKAVFIERIEKNLEFYLKGQVLEVKKIGQELLCTIRLTDLGDVCTELNRNPEFEINILNSINLYKSRDKYCLLVDLSSVTNNFSMLLKAVIPVEKNSGQQQVIQLYESSISVLKKIFEAAEFFSERKNLQESNSDIIIYPQQIDGLDCFDLYLSTEDDIVRKAFIDTGISRISSNGTHNNSVLPDVLAYISRYDHSAGIFPELCVCTSYEELMQLKVPKRVQYIRMMMSELYRVSSHLYFIIRISKILGSELVYNLALLERERTLRLIEFITGSRINPNYIRIGGVKRDLNAEQVKAVEETIANLYMKIHRIETLLLDNSIISQKLKNTGPVDKNTALLCGVTGPNLRACGIRYDIRKNRNLMMYKDMSFIIALGRYGDCLERVLLRFREIYQSIKIVDQIINDLPEEHIKKLINLSDIGIPFTEIISSVECPHGVFKVFMEIQDDKILNLIVMSPSKNSIYLAEKILPGTRVEDTELILASLDINSGEIMS